MITSLASYLMMLMLSLLSLFPRKYRIDVFLIILQVVKGSYRPCLEQAAVARYNALDLVSRMNVWNQVVGSPSCSQEICQPEETYGTCSLNEFKHYNNRLFVCYKKENMNVFSYDDDVYVYVLSDGVLILFLLISVVIKLYLFQINFLNIFLLPHLNQLHYLNQQMYLRMDQYFLQLVLLSNQIK